MGLAVVVGLVHLSVNAQSSDWQNEWHEQTQVIWESVEWSARLDLNRAPIAEFESQGFDSKQAICIVTHREQWGDWVHESELQQCGVSVDFIREHRAQWAPLWQHAGHMHLKENGKRGYRPQLKAQLSALPALNDKGGLSHHALIQANWGSWSRLSYLTQTDAGEKLGDFHTAAWEFKGLKNFQNLIIGRYQWNWNQGLVFAAPFAVGRSFNMGSWVHNEQQLRPAVSQNEDQGLWGVGTCLKFKKQQIYISIGADRIDTRLHPNGDAFTQGAYGGLHVSNLEISRKHNNLLQQGFIGWRRQFKNHAINLSHTRYRYSLPRVYDTNVISAESLSEYQHTLHRFLGARSLFNFAINNQGHRAYYIASAWSIHPHLDVALRIQSISNEFYAPERSPYTQSDYGKKGSEWGIDYQPRPQHQFLLRSLWQKPQGRFTEIQPIDYRAAVVLQYIYKPNRTDFFQVRWKQAQHIGRSQPQQIISQALVNLHPNWRLRVLYIWQQDRTQLPKSTAFLSQLGYKNGPINFQVYAASYYTTEPLYVTLPSAQFPWRLGIFNGSGRAFGISVRQRIHPKIRLRYSVDWMQKTFFSDLQSQKPRIFVQLEIL